jgi:hypothetical protein
MSSPSYTAKGVEGPPPFDEELGSAQSYFIRDLVPELVSRPQALRQYDIMARTDAVCSVSLRAGKVPIQAADFYVDPIGDGELAVTVGKFVEYNLFEFISSPWTYVLSRVLKMFQHGSSILEPVYTQGVWAPTDIKGANRKNYTMLKKLAYRPGPTIVKIDYDDHGGPEVIHHLALRSDGKSDEVEIPIDKAIIFTMGDNDNLLGDSLLRSAYPHWYYKTHLYKVDAIQKERHGIGVPKGMLPPGFKKADKDAMNELLRNLRTNEKAEMTLPPGYQVEFAELKGQLVDVLKSAGHHDILIMLNVFAEFMMLGLETSGGGRATSGAQTDIFYKSLWFIAESICACFNMFLIPRLVRYNFETDVIPQLKVRNIGQSRDLQQFAAGLANLFHNQIITPDIDTEQWARTQVDMPQKKGGKQTPIKTSTPAFGGNGNQPTPSNPPTADISASGGQGNMTKGPTQA